MSLPGDCCRSALAPSRLFGFSCLAWPSYRRGADQAALYLGPEPSISPLRYCLTQRLGVYLLEWLPASRVTGDNGIGEYASVISECVATVSSSIRGAKPFMIGHSLGGTLAAIASALAPDSIQALVLLGTPLCFEPGKSRFRDTLVSLVRPTLSEGPPVPGSLLSQVSVLASPTTFIWSRLADAAVSATDRYAMDIHARVERWALDEAPLPGKLVHEMVEWLYRENRLCRGVLEVCNMRVGPFSLSVPTLAVVNTADEVAPLASIKPFIEAMPTSDVRIIQFPGRRASVCSTLESWSDAKRMLNSGRKSLSGSIPISETPPKGAEPEGSRERRPPAIAACANAL